MIPVVHSTFFRGYLNRCSFRIISYKINRFLSTDAGSKIKVSDLDSETELSHIPVMPQEVINALQPKDDQV